MKTPGQLTMGAVTGQSHCCGATAPQDETIQETLPEALKSSVRETNGWSTTHPSCMPISLME